MTLSNNSGIAPLLNDELVNSLPDTIASNVRTLLNSPDSALSELTRYARELINEKHFSSAHILTKALYRTTDAPQLGLCLSVCSAARECGDHALAFEVASSAHRQFHDNWYLKAEYLQAAFALGKDINGLPLARFLTESRPEIPWGWHLRARAAEKSEMFEESVASWKRAVDAAPENGNYILALLNSLIQQGDTQSAKEVFSKNQQSISSSKELQSVKSRLFETAPTGTAKQPEMPLNYPAQKRDEYFLHDGRYDYDLMVETARQLVQANPESYFNYLHLLNAYFRGGRYDEAWELAEYLSSNYLEFNHMTIAHKAKILDGWGRYGEGIVYLEANSNSVDAGIAHIRALAQRYYRSGRIAEAYILCKKVHDRLQNKDSHVESRMLLAEVEIAMEQPDLAIKSIQKVKSSIGNDKFETRFPEFASWLAFQMGNLEQARRIYAIQNQQRPFHTLFKSTPPVEVKEAETESIHKKQVVMLTHVYNEMPKIKAFLMHYRRLGVEVFYITDNASTDGTHEYLLQQPDVRLFYSDTAFSHAGFGIWWINHLVQRYGNGRWCMHADVDELLIYPHCENLGLQQLTEYMDAREQKVLLSYMLDLFPERIADVLEWDGLTPPQEVCPYFDDTVDFVSRPRPPYKEMWGGFRARIMGDGHGPGQLSIKTPLFKAEEGFTFHIGTHYSTPVVATEIVSACLHFKFIGDIEKKYAETVNHDEHHDSCYTYRQYLSWLDTVTPEDDLRGPDTFLYRNSSSLLERGLIRTSVHFEDFAKRQIPTFQAGLPKTFLLTAPGASIEQLKVYLRSLGLQGEVESTFPVHTKTDLIDHYAGSQIFSGLAVLHDFEYLYHLIPEAHFILVPPAVVSWGELFNTFCLTELKLLDFGSITKLYKDKKKFHALPKRERGILLCILQFMENCYSWNDAGNQYVKRVQQFFSNKESGRFVTLASLKEEELKEKLSTLDCFRGMAL